MCNEDKKLHELMNLIFNCIFKLGTLSNFYNGKFSLSQILNSCVLGMYFACTSTLARETFKPMSRPLLVLDK